MIHTLITHNQRFHTDDVFSYAVLDALFPDAKFMRERPVDAALLADPSVLVFDVGGQYDSSLHNFDHHQRGRAGARQNGIPYAAFGLIWKHFGHEYIKRVVNVNSVLCSSIWQAVDVSLVSYIDGVDNGFLELNNCTATAFKEALAPVTLQSVIESYNPREANTTEEQYRFRFMDAWQVAKNVLIDAIKQAHSRIVAEDYFRNTVKENEAYIVLPSYFSWQSAAIAYPQLKFVIIPRPDTKDFVAVQVPLSLGSMQGRANFPVAWRGLQGTDLQVACGEPSAEFCHASGFMLVTRDLEALRRLVLASV